MSIHFGQYTTQPRQLFLKEDEKISRNLKPSEPTVVSVEPGDKFEQREKNYESLLKELKGIVSDMYHPKDINEKRIVVLYLNKILQCDDVPDMMSDLWIDMVEKYQAELDKNDAENGTVTPSSGEDTGIQAKKDELEAKRAEKQKLETEIQILYKQIGPKYTYDDFKKDVENLGKQIGAIEKEIMDLEAEIAEYEAAHSEDTSTGGGLVEEVSDEAFDIDGNKVGETILLKDSSGNVISEKNVQYDKSGNIISEASIKRDDKGNISSEERVKYENGKPSGYTVINYERDEEGRVTTSNSVELDKNHTKVGSRKTEFTYDEEGNVASSTYTHYDRSGKKTSSTTDKYETYTNANGSGGTRSASRSSEYYDDDGNFTGMSKVEYGYDEAGNQISEETTYYDSNTKEVGGTIVTYDADHSVTARKTVSFDRDDADNIREKRVVDTIDPNSGMATHGTTEYFDEVGNKTGSDEFTVETNELGYPVTETRVKFNESGVKVSESNTEYDSEGRNTYNKIVNFDEAGNQTGSTEFKQVFREDGQLDSQTVIEYDADGNVVTTSTVKCEYDKNGKVLSENFVTTNKDGVEIDSATNSYRYDAGGNVTRMEKFESKKDENGKLLTEKTTIYDGDNNKLLEDTYRYNEYGVIVGGETINYDEQGKVSDSSKFKVELDENSYELSRIIDFYSQDGTKIKTSITKPERDEAGNVVSQTETVIHYDAEENPISEETTVFDAAGNKISQTRSTYDADGNKIDIKTEITESIYKKNVDGTWVDCKVEVATEIDADGNVISEMKTYYDENNEVASSSRDEYQNGIRVKNTTFTQNSGSVTTDGITRTTSSTQVTLYDETGNKETLRTIEERFNDTNELYQESVMDFQENGKSKTWNITEYDENGKPKLNIVVDYDENGKPATETRNEYENGKLTKTTITAKDNDKKKYKEIINYGDDEKPVSKSHIDYDENGNKSGTVLENYTYSSDGVLQSIKVTKFDKYGGRLSEETIPCDENGNPIGDNSKTSETSSGSNPVMPPASTGEKVDPTGIDPATLDFSKHTVEKPASTDIPYVAGSKTKTETKNSDINHKQGTVETTTQTAPDGSVIVRKVNKYADGSIDSISLIKYDSKGNIISSVSHNNYGTDNAYVVETYKDANGNLTSEKQYSLDTSGNVKEFHLRTWTYNADGTNTKTETDYDKDGNVTGVYITKVGKNSSGNDVILAKSHYDKDGNLTSSTTNDYLAVTTDNKVYLIQTITEYKEGKSRVETTISYDKNSQKLSEKKVEYDKNGNLSVVKEFDKITSSSRTERYYYDKDGNPTYATIEVDERDESRHPVSNTKITISYNSDGTREEITSVYDYSTGETTKTKKVYDANGNPINS